MNDGQRGDDNQKEYQGNPFDVGRTAKFFKHQHTEALIHTGFYKSRRKHETAHDKPAGIAPVIHGHLLAADNPGEDKNQTDAEGHPGQRDAFGHKAENNEHHHGDGHLDVPGAPVRGLFIRARQVLILQLVGSQFE